jgi:hypothetical protein
LQENNKMTEENLIDLGFEKIDVYNIDSQN